ncbi:MAG: hypothetical protein HDR02_08795 [Lachnospiraceae bacterium]|nr:hypothetical protein [Lachnospiraceae bacterium]
MGVPWQVTMAQAAQEIDEDGNVCDIKCDNGEDIICVLVNKDNVIIHIEQGWFMLKRQQ